MLLIAVFALLSAVHAQWNCSGLCKNQNRLREKWPSRCCGVNNEAKRSTPQISVQTSVTINNRDASIYYEPTKPSPSVTVIHPFLIINPFTGLNYKKKSSNLSQQSEPWLYQETKFYNKLESPHKFMTKRNDDKFDFGSTINGQPAYFDIGFNNDIASRSAVNSIQIENLHYIETKLVECMNINLLLEARKTKNDRLKKEKLSPDLQKYTAMTDAELNQEVENNCEYSANLMNESLQEIKDNRPRKKTTNVHYYRKPNVLPTKSKMSEEKDVNNNTESAELTSTTNTDILTTRDTVNNEYNEFIINYRTNDNKNERHFINFNNIPVDTSSTVTTAAVDTTIGYFQKTEPLSVLTRNTTTTTATDNNYLPKVKRDNESSFHKDVNDIDSNVTDNLNTTERALTASKSQIESRPSTEPEFNIMFTSEKEGLSLSDSDSQILARTGKQSKKLRKESNFLVDDLASTTSDKLPVEKDVTSTESTTVALVDTLNHDEHTRSSYTEDEVVIPKVLTREFNDTVISELNGTEELPNNDFVGLGTRRSYSSTSLPDSKENSIKLERTNSSKIINITVSRDESTEITGKLYFLYDKKQIPARFVQDEQGIHIGLDALALCSSFQNKSLLVSSLCKCFTHNNCTITN